MSENALPRFAVGQFLQGLAVPWRGYQFLKANPQLWRYGAIPLFLNLLISVAMSGVLYWLSQNLWDRLSPFFPVGWFGSVLSVVAGILIFLLSVGLVMALWMLVGALLCGIFYSSLAMQVELKLGVDRSNLREVPLHLEVLYTLRTTSILVSTNLALLLLNFVPGFGSLLAGVLGAYVSCFWLGWEFFDYPLSLRALDFRSKRVFIKKHRFYTLGMGAAVILFTFIPILGPFCLTTAVVGSVLLHARLAHPPQAALPR